MRTLSKTESKVMGNTGKTITTLDVVGILNCKKSQANVILHRMSKKGWLKRVRRGLYVKKEKISSAYELLNILTKHYYISYLTALNLRGLTTQVPKAILAISLDRRKELEYENTRIKLVKTIKKKFFGFKEEEIEGVKVNLATAEKALLDSLDRPEYAGGLKHVLSCFERDFNSNKIARYALRLDNRALIRRLGAILEKKEKLPSEELKEKLLRKAEERSYYTLLGKGKEKEKIEDWKVKWSVK